MSDLLHRTLGEKIEVETVLAGGLWRADIDVNQLENAILNLGVNARDAMPKGGKLTIETANAYLDDSYVAQLSDPTAPGQYVLIAVSDNGAGMPEEVKSKVFEPFFTTKPVGQGTGLGLAQVYGFVQQSRGHVAIYSEEGLGTTVKLYFPRWKGREANEPVSSGSAEEALTSAHGELILVVEDDPLVRDFSVTALEEAGYEVLSAADGPAGLTVLEQHGAEIALLFTDVVLTGPLNGREVADRARTILPGLPVLFTTGYSRNAIVHHGRLDEGVELLPKPFTASALAARVRTLLDRARPT
jgi:CheY-like chemotaxis protein